MNNKVIVALDFDNKSEALALVDQLSSDMCRLKIGKEMFTLFGPQFIQEIKAKGFDIFLDLKFHDIPNTVAKAIRAAAELGVWMVNVHASGGEAMMQAAKKALVPYGEGAPLLIAVTVLTSMSDEELPLIGVNKTVGQHVIDLATLSKKCGLDGVVCSAQEAQELTNILGTEFQLVTPGIRPAGSDIGDQHRIMTPKKAIESGSDHLVIGRPITQSDNPLQSLKEIFESIN